MTEAITDKIKKLLRIGQPGSGATEDEASTAMGLAAALMLKHGIDVQLDDDKDEPGAERGDISWDHEDWHTNCANAAAYLYSCRVLVYRRQGGISFVGRSDNIGACEMTLGWLITAVEQQYKAHLPRGMSKIDRANYRRTFKWSCSMRLAARAWAAIMESLRRDDLKALEATGCRALVVVKSIDAQLAEIDAMLGEMSVKTLVVHPKAAGLGTLDGRRAGDSVELQKKVSS